MHLQNLVKVQFLQNPLFLILQIFQVQFFQILFQFLSTFRFFYYFIELIDFFVFLENSRKENFSESTYLLSVACTYSFCFQAVTYVCFTCDSHYVFFKCIVFVFVKSWGYPIGQSEGFIVAKNRPVRRLTQIMFTLAWFGGVRRLGQPINKKVSTDQLQFLYYYLLS